MTDKNLIFLISLPRSGSTLTQKIISAHKDVYTRSEHWIMINPLYALKNEGTKAEYNKKWEYGATQDFISHLPGGGKNRYSEHLRNMYLSMYNDYLTENTKTYFLDKAPRYYLIINELQEVFPNAKFILLVRNPLGVLSSIISTWTKSDWYKVKNFRVDLTKGVDIITDELLDKRDNIFIMRYEEMLADPSRIFQKCFDYLNLDFSESYIRNYAKSTEEKWLRGDQKGIYEKNGIDTSNSLKWIEHLNDPQHWRVLYDYLQTIGREKFNAIGYDFDDYEQLLMDHMPLANMEEISKSTLSLADILMSKAEKKEKIITGMQSEIESLKEKNRLLEKKFDSIGKGILHRPVQVITKLFKDI